MTGPCSAYGAKAPPLLVDELLIWIDLLQLQQELLRNFGLLQLFRKKQCREQPCRQVKLVIPILAHERLQDPQGELGSTATGHAF
ncbi:MAG: hypothetical protein IPH71_16220 [Proteobacteria bacterium]|nr:hypothetical protein [Pseudomonadota bacterium]